MNIASDLVLVPAWAVRDRRAIVDWIPNSIGEHDVGPTLAACSGAVLLDRPTCTVLIDGAEVGFRLTGFLFLERLLSANGEPQAGEVLTKVMWGTAATPDSSSLRAVVHDVRRRLGRHARHVRSVRKVGYRWCDTCSDVPSRPYMIGGGTVPPTVLTAETRSQ